MTIMTEKISILYVDDEPVNLQLFKFNFHKKFNIITAASGFEGLDLLNHNPKISIVISDMKMPGMNGLEFITKAKLLFPGIVFFILTGFDITPEIEEALNTKLIRKYCNKPFKIKELEEAIIQVLNNPENR
jgi:two-component system response regulator (stage 0 sporulation protein F)